MDGWGEVSRAARLGWHRPELRETARPKRSDGGPREKVHSPPGPCFLPIVTKREP